MNKIITEDQFNRVKSKLELELNRKITRLNEIKDLSISEVIEDNNKKKIENYINKFLSMKNPSRELIVNLIDRINIYEDKRIDVKLSFNNMM